MPRHWQKPTFSASSGVSSSMWRMRTLRSLRLSTHRMINAPTMNAPATTGPLNRYLVICLWIANPITAAGRKPTRMLTTSLRELALVVSVPSVRLMSCQ